MNGKSRIRAAGLVALFVLALPAPATAEEPATLQAPIRSQADFDAYMRNQVGKPTPLDRLSPGARERFLLDLEFGRSGLNGFNPENLAYDLGQADIEKLLALFGLQEYAPKSRLQPGDDAKRTSQEMSELERRYNAFYRRMRQAPSDKAKDYADAVARAFDEALPEAYDATALRALSAHDLGLLYRGARVAARVTPQTRRMQAYRNAYAELERRKLAGEDDALEMRNLLLVARRFDEARTFTAAHADEGLAALPDFRDRMGDASGAATVWRLDDDGKTLSRVAVDLSPIQILVTAGCHFSQDAATDISADPILGPAFARHGRWLVDSPGREDIEAARDWNRRFPHAQVDMIYDPAEWTLFPNWSMPVFYIVRDGKVLARLPGWAKDPPEEFRQPLIDTLRRYGLLAESTGAPP